MSSRTAIGGAFHEGGSTAPMPPDAEDELQKDQA
jgi:hypothetical protein